MPLKPINTKDRLDIIKNNPVLASRYAIHVRKKRWQAAEPVIMKHAPSAFNYAYKILKRNPVSNITTK